MTRETKLGLVVAGSFLALVGGVVVARLKHVDLPGDGAEVAVAPPTLRALNSRRAGAAAGTEETQ